VENSTEVMQHVFKIQ